MDLNLVRLCIPLTAAAEPLLMASFTNRRAVIEHPLAQLCSRSLSSDPELVRRHQKPGLPFVFSLPCHGQLDCVLLGPAIAELSRILAVVSTSASLPMLASFTAYDYQGSAVDLTADGGDELPVLSLAQLLDMATPRYAACRRLRITLQTPLRLMAVGRELNCFDPARFVRSVLRRISSLSAYYGIAGDPETFARLADLAGALHVVEAKPVSAPQGKRGVLGSYIVQGPMGELGPLLELGGLLHLGKGASYGLGAFQITPLS